jgi:hypothetical protein
MDRLKYISNDRWKDYAIFLFEWNKLYTPKVEEIHGRSITLHYDIKCECGMSNYYLVFFCYKLHRNLTCSKGVDLLYEYMIFKLPWSNFRYERFVKGDNLKLALIFQILKSY